MPGEGTLPRAGTRRRPHSTAGFLRRSFDIIRRQDPARYEELRDHLLRVPAGYRVDGERFSVVVRRGRIEVIAGTRSSVRADIATTAPDVLRLVDGTASLTSLLADARLQVWADADALLDLSAAGRLFAAAATGSGLLQREFEDFRGWVLDRPNRDR